MALTAADIDNALAAVGLDIALPAVLRQAWVKAYTENDQNGALATIKMREHPDYEVYYPGMLNPEGIPRFENEATYEAAIDAYQQTMVEAGVDPSLISREQYGSLVAGMVSPSEFNRRVNAVVEGVTQRGEEVRQFYATNYGIDMSDQAIITSVIDPTLGDAVLQEQIRVAQIGGAASRFGFDTDIETAADLEDIGIQYQEALDLFEQAAQQIPLLGRLTQRHGDVNDPFDLTDFLDAAAFGSPEAINNIQRLVRTEVSGFNQRAFANAEEGVTGLVDR